MTDLDEMIEKIKKLNPNMAPRTLEENAEMIKLAREHYDLYTIQEERAVALLAAHGINAEVKSWWDARVEGYDNTDIPTWLVRKIVDEAGSR